MPAYIVECSICRLGADFSFQGLWRQLNYLNFQAGSSQIYSSKSWHLYGLNQAAQDCFYCPTRQHLTYSACRASSTGAHWAPAHHYFYLQWPSVWTLRILSSLFPSQSRLSTCHCSWRQALQLILYFFSLTMPGPLLASRSRQSSRQPISLADARPQLLHLRLSSASA